MSTSFRTSFAERNSKTHELRKDSLFNMVDETKTGTIDKSEFGNLFDVIRAEAEAENVEKLAMAKKQQATARKTKLFGCVAACMGFLEVKGSDQIVQTAQATSTLPMIVAPVIPMK